MRHIAIVMLRRIVHNCRCRDDICTLRALINYHGIPRVDMIVTSITVRVLVDKCSMNHGRRYALIDVGNAVETANCIVIVVRRVSLSFCDF